MDNEVQLIPAPDLTKFCCDVFQKVGLSAGDAAITTDVLIAADLRGIDSHGIARLRFYLDGLHKGWIKPGEHASIVQETTVTALLDAGGGMGPPVSYRAMQMAISKAKQHGLGLVLVKNSNHYGIAGYYAMMALAHDCIGISLTNSYPFAVPTYGRQAVLGTNPIALAAPAGKHLPFVLDMATSVIPYGKIELHARASQPLELGWAVDPQGLPTRQPDQVIRNVGKGPQMGGLLPLGGAGKLLGGHKGYGLMLMVDILCGVLPGSLFADLMYPSTPEGQPLPAGVGHLFGAIRIDAFRPLEDFKKDMDELQQRLKDSPKALGEERIVIHGEPEFETAKERAIMGIPIPPKLAEQLRQIASEFGIQSPV